MPGHSALRARQEIIKRQADFDDQRPALARPIQQVGKLERRVEQTGKPAKNRHGRAQRFGVMGRVLQHEVALAQRFIHQPEFAVLQITNAAMQHVGGAGAGAAAEVAAFHQQDVDALQRQIAEGADAIDAAAYYQDGDIRLVLKGLQGILSVHPKLAPVQQKALIS